MIRKLSIASVGIMLTAGLSAQVLVGTDPMLKNSILEEYTGIHCTYCPDGHAIAQSIMDANPGRAFTIAVHQGSFATPSGSEPDFRTDFGDALAGQTGLTGYPSGTVNRLVFSGSQTALSRGSWSASAAQVRQEVSPVNIGISSSYVEATRELTVNVELYYTSDASASSNFINVALIQDSIYGPQTGGGAGSNYRHMHMLRHLITGQWGDEVTTTTTGSLVNRTYVYTVPDSYRSVPAVVENMKVVAFVTKSHQEIYTGDEVDAIGGTNLYIGKITSAEPYIKRGYPGDQRIFNLEALSNITGDEQFEFTLEPENAPADWQASFIIDGQEYTSPAVITLSKGVAKAVIVKVVAGELSGFPGYVLKMKSVTSPAAPEKIYRVMVISGVTDLVVNGTGGPQSSANQAVYLEGLAASGIDSYAVTDANVMRDMITSDAFWDVFNLWLNIAWTFPALTDDQAEAVMDFMDAGHNVFIAGQDIGWDIMSGASGSNGTAVTRNFYTNYLNAGFVDDGSSSNNKLAANASDPVFGAVAQSNIVDVYAGNMFPDVINALAGSDVIFNYNGNASLTSAIKYQAGNYRTIYFGVGMEMLSNEAIRNEIIQISRIWLTGDMTGIEYNHAVNALISGNNYPNPASDYTWIRLADAAKGGVIEVYNMNGAVVLSANVGVNTLYRLDVSKINSGIYTCRLKTAAGESDSFRLVISR
ncbi:MAG TPA: hypothetical protein DEO70_02280 [Bacteroidales bacterium]|nr:MAG: hypothetical protein A2X11_05810 [Bacteroidetes bacterium GWE2_42_24]OFY31270.1 MAG: hypothetical protein A2X09_10620 [Bacteroidetes bacterium GWF2_43_11]HBZ65635.1 hypothetical protein [Bacteroidales bacterium]